MEAVDITVVRGVGSKEGEDIFEPILATEGLALQRGKAEINERSQPMSEKEITLPFTSGIEAGQLMLVTDSLQGAVYVGKVTATRHSVRINPPESATVVTLEVPLLGRY